MWAHANASGKLFLATQRSDLIKNQTSCRNLSHTTISLCFIKRASLFLGSCSVSQLKLECQKLPLFLPISWVKLKLTFGELYRLFQFKNLPKIYEKEEKREKLTEKLENWVLPQQVGRLLGEFDQKLAQRTLLFFLYQRFGINSLLIHL